MFDNCLNRRRFFFVGGVVFLAVVCLIALASSVGVAMAATQSGAIVAVEMEFALEEFSVFDKEFSQGQISYQLTSGQQADQGVSNEPMEAVKSYPEVASEKAVYGKITFGQFIFDTSDNFVRYFVIDESEGTGKGYDKLYFDLDGDLDLSNDAAVGRLAESPKGDQQDNELYFEGLEFSARTPKGSKVDFKLMPLLRTFGEGSQNVSFIVPTGRRGKIKIGDKEFDAKLVQGFVIGGRYDSPATLLVLDNEDLAFPLLSAVRKFGDVLYRFSTNAAGDKLVVMVYDGDYGVLKAAGDGGKIVLGYLMSADAFVDLADCAKKDGGRLVPVGDWRPLGVAVETKDIRYGISSDIAAPGQEVSEPIVYGIKISKDKAFVLEVGGEVEVRFKTPTKRQKFAAGETLQVSAMMYYRSMGVMLSSLEDKSKPKGDAMTMPDGTKMQQYETIDPEVKITDSAGKTVAEGKMPFG